MAAGHIPFDNGLFMREMREAVTKVISSIPVMPAQGVVRSLALVAEVEGIDGEVRSFVHQDAEPPGKARAMFEFGAGRRATPPEPTEPGPAGSDLWAQAPTSSGRAALHSTTVHRTLDGVELRFTTEDGRVLIMDVPPAQALAIVKDMVELLDPEFGGGQE